MKRTAFGIWRWSASAIAVVSVAMVAVSPSFATWGNPTKTYSGTACRYGDCYIPSGTNGCGPWTTDENAAPLWNQHPRPAFTLLMPETISSDTKPYD